MHSYALFAFAAALFSCTIFVNVLGFPSQPKTERGVSAASACPGGICATNECRVTAKLLLDSLDEQVDPCENFYDYACGGWIKTHPVPGNEPGISQFWNIAETTKLKVQQIIQTANRPTTFKSEQTVKQIYQQCQDRDQLIEKAGAIPIMQLLGEQIGGWPIITPNWNPKNFDLMEVLTTLRTYLDEPLFKVQVFVDLVTPTKNVIWMGEPTLFTTGDVLQSGNGKLYMDSYLWYLRNVTAMMINDTGRRIQNAAQVDRDISNIIDLERYLVLSGLTALDSNDLSLTKNRTSLRDIRQSAFRSSNIARNLTSYVKSVFALVDLANEISDSTQIVLKSPQYFVKLDSKLTEIERLGDEGKRRMANYIGWQLIKSYGSYLSKTYRTAEAEYTRRVYGQSAIKVTPTNEQCASTLLSFMQLPVGAMYVNKAVPADLKEKAEMMANDIKAGFGELLQSAAWMDKTTYQKAQQKLAAMLRIIAYPDIFTRNLSAIDELYKNVRLENTFFKTLHGARKAYSIVNLSNLKHNNTRGDPLHDSPDVTAPNAEYKWTSNLMAVYAGILQRPFYNSQSPQYLNYGGIGSIFGHEITHGFDNQGSLFDSEGNMRSWWTEATRSKYDQRSQGMALQYNNFSLPAGSVNGLLTLGENIADNGGIKAAYRGYQRFRKRQTCAEPTLPGLEKFSVDQLFFISAGQVWCFNVRPEVEQLNLLTDVHSPARFRVIGEMSNLPEFSAAFKCPAGSKMNPIKKEMVW